MPWLAWAAGVAVPTYTVPVPWFLMSPDYTSRRVVCLQPSATVILAALGCLDRVVACTKYCADVCPEVKSGGRSIIADSWTAQSRQILAARPDLVIAAVPYQEKAVIEILKAGVRFLGVAPSTLADIYTDIATIAGAVGASHRVGRVIAAMQQEIEAVRAQTDGKNKRPRVFCEEWGKPLITSQGWVAELVAAAGGEFLGDPGSRRPPEAVLADDPEVLIAAWCGAGDRVPLEKLVRDRGWSKMSAVRNGRVFCIRDELLNTPAPTLVGGLRALAAAVHPQHFPQPDGLRCIQQVRDEPRARRPR
jgi:iron complex transport system substrate-binding protein